MGKAGYHFAALKAGPRRSRQLWQVRHARLERRKTVFQAHLHNTQRCGGDAIGRFHAGRVPAPMTRWAWRNVCSRCGRGVCAGLSCLADGRGHPPMGLAVADARVRCCWSNRLQASPCPGRVRGVRFGQCSRRFRAPSNRSAPRSRCRAQMRSGSCATQLPDRGRYRV